MGGWIEQKARGVGPTIFFVLPFGELFVITSIITREGGREERDDEDETRESPYAGSHYQIHLELNRDS